MRNLLMGAALAVAAPVGLYGAFLFIYWPVKVIVFLVTG